MNNLNNPPITYPGITTQTDVSASRALGTVYQNTLTKSTFCIVSVLTGVGNTNVLSDSNAAPATVIAQFANANLSSIRVAVSFWVLPGNYYEISSGAASLLYWIEYT